MEKVRLGVKLEATTSDWLKQQAQAQQRSIGEIVDWLVESEFQRSQGMPADAQANATQRLVPLAKNTYKEQHSKVDDTNSRSEGVNSQLVRYYVHIDDYVYPVVRDAHRTGDKRWMKIMLDADTVWRMHADDIMLEGNVKWVQIPYQDYADSNKICETIALRS